ncbi:MAG: hypothetical protein GXO43_09415 [Crenarchaeota archaeon]|nr:hypothetical protein [Thermoproteota archaeon]
MEKHINKTIHAAITGITAAILVTTIPGATKIHPWITIGRVTYLVLQTYSYTGDPARDILIASTLILIGALLTGRKALPVITAAIAGITFSLTGYTLQAFIAGCLGLTTYIAILIRNTGWRPVVYGFLGLLGGLGAYKILYTATRIAAGYYPPVSTPIWINLIINYYTWPLIPISIGITAILSGYILLSKTLGIKPFPNKLSPWLKTGIDNEEEKNGVYLLLVSLTLSLFLAIMSFIPSINPSMQPITTDYIYYYNWLEQAIREGIEQVMVARSDRPLYILLLYIMMRITGTGPSLVAGLQDIILFPLYTLATYMLARKTIGPWRAGYASLMAALSPILLSYAYGGFQADLFTLSLTFIALSMLLGNTKKQFVGGLILLGTTMFFHEWTWTQYTIIIAAYTVLTLIKEWRSKQGISWRSKILLIYLAVTVPADLAKTLFLGLFSSAKVIAAMSHPGTEMGFIEAHHFYTTMYTGGSLDNTLFYLLVIPGIPVMHPLILVATSLSLATVFIPYNIMYYRLLLNTPLPVMAGYTVSRIEKPLRILVFLEMLGLAMLRILSFIPGLSLTP